MGVLSLTKAALTCVENDTLTPSEYEQGEALRIARCVRADESSFMAWSVLYFKRNSFNTETPHLRGFWAFRSNVMNTYSSPVEASFILGDTLWNVKEFEIILPLSMRFFSLSCGRAKTKAGMLHARNLRHSHYEEIAHAATDDSYEKWLHAHRKETHCRAPQEGPLMSIVTPAYKTPPHYLRAMIDSVQSQEYKNWELVIVNASPDDLGMRNVLSSYSDDRIIEISHPENEGIAGNTLVGINATTGSYVSFLDHDDIVEPDALSAYVHEINKHDGEVDLLYCDEDSLDEHGVYRMPLFKPSVNLDLLYSNNYVIHWLTVSRRVLDLTKRSTKEVDGAQDYDLTFKALENAKKIVHVPRVLYHWRIHSGSINSNPDSKPYAQLAGQRAIENHCSRIGLVASVEQEEVPCTYRSEFKLPSEGLSIACVVFGDQVPTALEDALREYDLSNHNSCISEIVLCAEDSPLNRNKYLEETKSDVVLFVSEDIASLSDESIGVLAGYFQRPEVSMVAPRVLRKDGLIDYAGMCIRPDGGLMLMSRYLLEDDGGYIGRSMRPYSSLVVNSDYLMVRVKDILHCGGFNVDYNSSGYAVADMCIRLNEGNNLSVYTPFSQIVRKENGSLHGFCSCEDELEDRDMFCSRYGEVFADGDPSHNPNFDSFSPYYRLNKHW